MRHRRRHSPHHKPYSFFVRFMRIGLPLGAVFFVVLLFAWSDLLKVQDLFQEELAEFKGELKNGQISNAMSKPVLEASSKSGMPFKIQADQASHEGKDGVGLVAPVGSVTLKDGTNLQVKGSKGDYDQANGSFNVTGGVELKSSKGMTVKTQGAEFDVKKGAVVGHHGVTGETPQGTINAEGFEIKDKGDTLIFKGRTKLVIEKTKKEDTRK